MKKIDIIISWPRNCDYPLWRQFIRENRRRFHQIFIMFTETNQGEDYRNFVMEAMQNDDCLFYQPEPLLSGEDWRNKAVNTALQQSTGDWVWFTEQDFFIIDEIFWEFVNDHSNTADIIGVYDAQRLHPCCIFAKRDIINKTSKQFGIVPDKMDHFGQFQKDLDELGVDVQGIPEAYYYHMNGLSHNMTLAFNKQPITYHLEEFYNYLKKCLTCHIGLDYRTIRFIEETLPKGMR